MLLLSSLFVDPVNDSTSVSSIIMFGREFLCSDTTSSECLVKEEDNSVTSATKALRQFGHRKSKKV